MQIKADIVIVGSGAGGASVARELAKKGRDVLVIEKGNFVNTLGTQLAAARFYDRCAFRTSKEGIAVYRALMVGGTTVVSCGNGIVVLDKELKKLGIDLSDEFSDTLKELNVKPLADHLIGKGSRLIMDIGNKLGLEMVPMPKYVNPKKCISCGACVLGCKTGAKWSTVQFIKEMQSYGGRILTGLDVKSVLINNNNKAIGLIAKSGMRNIKITANKIVLSAGALGSPVILKRSGIKNVGNKLFADLLNVTYGILNNEEIKLYKEPTMAVVSTKFLEDKGFLISPFMDSSIVLGWKMLVSKNFKRYKYANLVGIMTKIKDDMRGGVLSNGNFYKTITANDYKKLNEGADIAKKILLKAGVKEKDIFITKPVGAHPGGTAAIGEVVNTNLMTEVKDLFVCDASVLPVASGAPPIVTLVSLAKRLSKTL